MVLAWSKLLMGLQSFFWRLLVRLRRLRVGQLAFGTPPDLHLPMWLSKLIGGNPVTIYWPLSVFE